MSAGISGNSSTSSRNSIKAALTRYSAFRSGRHRVGGEEIRGAEAVVRIRGQQAVPGPGRPDALLVQPRLGGVQVTDAEGDAVDHVAPPRHVLARGRARRQRLGQLQDAVSELDQLVPEEAAVIDAAGHRDGLDPLDIRLAGRIQVLDPERYVGQALDSERMADLPHLDLRRP